MVSTVTGWGKPEDLLTGAADTDSDWNHPVYYAQAGDPLYTIHCLKSWGTCEIEGLQVRIPDQARAAAAGDGHMAVVDQSGRWEYDFWQVKAKPAGGGQLVVSWGGRTEIGTDGADGLKSDATAAHYGLLAGLIRFPEIQAGKIDHALFMSVKCDRGGKVFPSNGHGSPCNDGSTPPPMGSRFFLDMSEAEIDALDQPYWRKAILRAMAKYGMFVGDTGASPWAVAIESGSTYTSFGMEDPWVAWAKQQEGVAEWRGKYYVDLGGEGIDFAKRLRVAAPCVSERTC